MIIDRYTSSFAALLAVCVLASSAAVAHHSNAMFDRTRELTIEGTVRQFQWTNPHVFIELTVIGPQGPYEYSIETSAPSILRSRGWKFNSLKPGDKVVAKVHPLKESRVGGGLVSLTKDGVTLGTAGDESAK